MKVAVLFGGISSERNVSINGGLSVCKALTELGHEVYPIDPSLGANGLIDINTIEPVFGPVSKEELSKFDKRELINCINSPLFDNIDVAFLVLHGKYGEDGLIQSLLELRGIPYTHSGLRSSALAIDKHSTKVIMGSAGVPTPAWDILKKEEADYDTIEQIRSELGNNIVIKPNDEGSTIGLTIVNSGNLDEIKHGIDLACEFSEFAMIEEFIAGRELTVAVLNGESLPVIEIIPHDGFFDFNNKYIKGKTDYICPADLSPEVEDYVRNCAEKAHKAIGCAGVSRIDFRLNDENIPYCMEVNTIAGFTSTSLVPMAAAAVGIDYKELCQKLIDLAIERK
jgi:D-alanine-D-alanine ligase